VIAFGSPVTPVLSGPSTSFPTTTVGTSSQRSVTLTATEPLTVTALSSNSSQFVVGTSAPALPAKLMTGETISVPITFEPTASGPLAATLMASTSTGKTATFSLSGSGQASGALLEASPTVLTFDGTTVGTGRSGGATFRNVGSEPLTIEGVEAPSAPFSLEGAPPIGHQLAPGEAITITVEFEPQSVGTYEDAVELETSGGSRAVQLVASAGTPAHLQIEGEPVDFGTVAVGSSAERSFTVTNTGGTAVTIYKSKPPSGGEFAATTSLAEGTTIAAGASMIETVEFAPTTASAASAVWLINGSDTSGLHEVHFSGVGEAPSSVQPPPGLSPPSQTSSPGAQLVQALPEQGVRGAGASAPPAPSARVTSARLSASRTGIVELQLSCEPVTSRCIGTLALRTASAVRIAASGRSSAFRRAVLTLAARSFSIVGGRSSELRLQLSKQALHLLDQARALSTRATLRLPGATASTASTSAPLTLRLAHAAA
jgi:hypothetical protein